MSSENSQQDLSSGSETYLLPLILDCNRMVKRLSKSLDYHREGKPEKAEVELKQVGAKIDGWLEKIEQEKTASVDSCKLASDLRKARQALDWDGLESSP